VINKALLIIMSSSVSLEAVLGDCLPTENWQLPRQLCCAKSCSTVLRVWHGPNDTVRATDLD